MAKVLGSVLPQNLVDFLSGGQCTILATATSSSAPYTATMSWVVARNEKTIRMAVDRRGESWVNIQENPSVCVEVLGDDLVVAVRGRASIIREQMESIPFPCGIVEITVDEVLDHSVPGLAFKAPSYVFDLGKEHRYDVEGKVFQELCRA